MKLPSDRYTWPVHLSAPWPSEQRRSRRLTTRPLARRLTTRRCAEQRRAAQGTTLTEVLVACTLLATLMGTASQMLVRNGRLQNSLAHERLALDELNNQLSELQLLEPGQVENAVQQLTVSAEVAERLPEAKLTGQVRPVDSARQVTLELRWQAAGRRDVPLRLSTWIYPKGGQP